MWQIQEFFFLLSVSFFEREREEKLKAEICLNPLAFPQREKKILENKIEILVFHFPSLLVVKISVYCGHIFNFRELAEINICIKYRVG